MFGHQNHHASPVRSLLVCAAAALAVLGLTLLVAPDLVDAREVITSGQLTEQRFEDLLVWACESLALAATAWLAILTVVVVLDVARGQDRLRTGCPAWLRQLTLAACGVGVTVAFTSPAHASGADSTASAGTLRVPDALHGLAYPDRPVDSPVAPDRSNAARSQPAAASVRAGPAGTDRPEASQRHTHLVLPGDTLWDIAAETLAQRADDTEIAERWREIFIDNADALGPNPDLIHPGTVLHLPED